MSRLIVLLGLALLFSRPALTQEGTRFEVSGGYTFQHWVIPDVFAPPGTPSLNMNGWNAGAGYHVNRWLAGVADITGTYKNSTGPNGLGDVSIVSYLFGPRVYPIGHHKLTPYVHALFGTAYYKETTAGFGSISESDFSWEVGGGIDYKLNQHFAIRLGQFDWQQTRFLGGGSQGVDNQNNFKYSVGAVVRFGRR